MEILVVLGVVDVLVLEDELVPLPVVLSVEVVEVEVWEVEVWEVEVWDVEVWDVEVEVRDVNMLDVVDIEEAEVDVVEVEVDILEVVVTGAEVVVSDAEVVVPDAEVDNVDDLDVELCNVVEDEELPHGTALQSGVYLDES